MMIIYFFYDIQTFGENSTDEYKLCQFMYYDFQMIGSWMDLINRVLLPFIFMVFFSILLIYSIFKSRRNVLNAFISSQNKKFQKEKRFP